MSKKGKAVAFDTRAKYQSLMRDYVDLQKEANSMRRTLETAKQRKLILAAEVRFLRRRYKQLVMAKDMNAAGPECLTYSRVSFKQTNDAREQRLRRNEGIQNCLPPVPELKSKKKQYSRRQVTRKKIIREETRNGLVLSSDPGHKGRVNVITKQALAAETTRVHGTRNSVASFDLNQDSRLTSEEASFPRAPVFDLNEISVGDEDFQTTVKFEEARKSLIRGVNDEQQNDLKLSFCRSVGERPARVGKRKISWQDPVALRV